MDNEIVGEVSRLACNAAPILERGSAAVARERAWNPMRGWLLAVLLIVAASGCATVQPWQREHLASPAMQFSMAPFAESQEGSVLEITEGSTFPSAGPGSAGAGCGCH